MILTREVLVTITELNYQYYENLGYDIMIDDSITIPIEILPKYSKKKIICQCDGDNCNLIKEVTFKNYNTYNNPWGYYYCRKCSEFKRKNTLKENHNCDYPSQNHDICQRILITKKSKRDVE